MEKRIRPSATEITLTGKNRVLAELPEQTVVPRGLVPLVTRSFQLPSYRVMAGWPVSAPGCDVRATAVVSCEGEVITMRDFPTLLRTGAIMRWVADDTYYDGLEWKPAQDETGGIAKWSTTPDYAPVLITDYEYRVKNERFVRSALNFDSDTQNHMWADFTTTIGGANGYTVLMVMSPNSTFSNNVEVPYNGLWCPADSAAGYASVTVQGRYLYYETETSTRTRTISIDPELNSNAPLYLAVVVDRPSVSFYVGTGPNGVRSKSLTVGETVTPLGDAIFLGRTAADLDHTADMALFDLGIYPTALTAAEVRSQFSVLSQSYGGDV